MITKKEIDQKAVELEISPANVERDYVFGWVLNAIYSGSSLGNEFILKGGNGLRKSYLPNTRFSKDLDFSVEKEVNQRTLHDELNKICSLVSEKAGVVFELDRTMVRPKNLPFTDNNVLEARLYFKGFYGKESISIKTQLDITQFDKIYLPVQEVKLIHGYPDCDKCEILIKCQKAEEILASKLNTLLHRQKVADLFDLLYSIVFTSDYSVNKKEVISTFLKKSIFTSSPNVAKQQLLGVQLDTYRPYWSTLVAPITSLFDFDSVVSNFAQFIEDLFSFSVPIAVTTAGPSHFSSGVRNEIREAGRSRTLVEMSYDGYTRLVEPYSMKYEIRKKDGRGFEYFWGHDTSGGKSGKQSIKRFICDKIGSASCTEISFTPRYPVEF